LEPSTNPRNNKRQSLSEEATRKIAEISTQIEKLQSSTSMFIKFKDKEHKLLPFIPERTYSDLVSYPNSPEKPVQRYKFYGYDLAIDSYSQEVKEWTVGPTVAKELLRWISKGYLILSITRHGLDLKTTYDVEPVLD
jgi:hypothetical protein